MPVALLGVLVLGCPAGRAAEPAGTAAPAACPIVDRGSVTDGQTTIALVFPPAPCPPDSNWTGWRCAGLRSTANSNGVSYLIDVRWNRDGLPCAGTVTWLQGGGRVFHRENTTYAKAVQDELDVVDGIRTVEIALLGNAFLSAPRNGFPNISAVYADLVEYLVRRGVAEGVLVHFGNSGGSLIGANALAYHDLDQVLDGMVFGGGPYWSDLSVTCLDPNWTNASGRADADAWNWLEFNGTAPCSTMSSTPNPTYDCRSTLGSEADTVYDGMTVSVIIGQTDPFLPWINNAASAYYQRITAATKTYDRPANCGHTLMNFVSGAATVKQRIRDVVAAAAPVVDAGEGAVPKPGPILTVSPNPSSGVTRVAFRVPHDGPVALTVHDAAGRRIATLLNGERTVGPGGAIWAGLDDSGRPVPAGVYFLRLRAGDAAETRKVVRIR